MFRYKSTPRPINFIEKLINNNIFHFNLVIFVSIFHRCQRRNPISLSFRDFFPVIISFNPAIWCFFFFFFFRFISVFISERDLFCNKFSADTELFAVSSRSLSASFAVQKKESQWGPIGPRLLAFLQSVNKKKRAAKS